MKVLILTIALVTALAGQVFSAVAVRIERSELARPGDRVTLTLAVVDSSDAFRTGGFELMVRYDTTLTLVSVNRGQMLNLCGWEYFTYSLLGVNNIHITAIADLANGSQHPYCFGMPVADLVDITFDIPTNYNLYGRFLPVQFVWYNCGDNGFSSRLGDTLFISNHVYAFDGIAEWEITRDTAFPSLYGAPSSCPALPGARLLNFHNGGISLMTQDLQPPVASCPSDMTVATGPGECAAVVQFTATVTDNRPGATISCTPPSGSYFYRGVTNVRCIAVDAAGNRDTCGFTVTVVDTFPPLLVCPHDTVLGSQPNLCGAVFNYSASVYDNCPGTTWSGLPPPGSFFSLGTTDVVVTATDALGNRVVDTFFVTVEDRQWPIAIHPDAVATGADPGQCGSPVTFSVSVSDNCPYAYVTASPPSGTVFPVGTTDVRVIAVDVWENRDTSWFPVTVYDVEPPVLVCPDSVVAVTDSGTCGAVVEYSVTATDNCGSPELWVSIPSGSTFPLGTTDVYAVAVDSYGNRDSSAFRVIVRDSEPPLISAPGDLTVTCDSGACGAVVVYDVSVTDNCGSPEVTVSLPSGSFFPVGTTLVDVTTVDASGNVATTGFTVAVRDLEPPTLQAPSDISVISDSGLYGAIVNFQFSASDNCEGVAAEATPVSGSMFPTGTTTVRLTARDAAGNADTAQFNVTVMLDDPDADGWPSWADNCPEDPNTEQIDTDGDGTGDACCCQVRGDVNDAGPADAPITMSDLTALVAYLMQGGAMPPCPEQANADGSVETGSRITVADLTYLIAYLFRGGTPPPPCP